MKKHAMIYFLIPYKILTVHDALELEDGDVSNNEAQQHSIIQLVNYSHMKTIVNLFIS